MCELTESENTTIPEQEISELLDELVHDDCQHPLFQLSEKLKEDK